MPSQILVISTCHETAQKLCAILRSEGHPASGRADLILPSQMEHRPAVCIIDLEFSHDGTSGVWQEWLHDCQASRTACLAFDRSRVPDPQAIAKLEPLSDVLLKPEDGDLLKGKIHNLLTIRKLAKQLDATRHQLSCYQQELQEALQSAAYIQRSLIPKRQPAYNNLQYSWRYLPCKQVGGDLFNIAQLDEQTVLTYLLDVSGHGISSAMVTVSVHQSLSLHTGQLVKRLIDRPPYYEISPPSRVLQELEAEYPFERFEEFFTISYMLINPHTGQLRYSNAGHPPPLLIRRDGSVERLDAGGTVIGVGAPMTFQEDENRMNPGDRIFMYTDGIIEHLGKSGEAYGEQRFLDQLRAQPGKPLGNVTRNALIAMREFGGSSLPIDDITLIGMEFR